MPGLQNPKVRALRSVPKPSARLKNPKHRRKKVTAATWRATLATATAKAKALLPAGVAGETATDTVLADAQALLAKIKAALVSGIKSAANAYVQPDKWVLRKAAGVLARGASDAAKFAAQVKDDMAKDLKSLASQAWNVAVGPMVIVGLGLYVLAQDKHTDDAILAGLGLFAAKFLL